MILHFIRSDFRAYRFLWIVVVVLSCLMLPGIIATHEAAALLVVFYLYLIFALMPLSNLAGVTWRSQHVMSRNYLLSLPVSRRKLFLALQCRAMVFWVPLLALLIIGLFGENYHLVNRFASGIPYPLFAVMIVLTSNWYINQMIAIQLEAETINTYLTLEKRALAWLRLSLKAALEVFVVALGCFSAPIPVFLRFLILLAIVATRFRLTQQRWLGGAAGGLIPHKKRTSSKTVA